jgi:uncharacterized phiE125 gp8 family phage protein
MLAYSVTTDSASEPLTKTEVRFQLKNESITSDDDLLDIYIKAARQMVEERTNTALISKTIQQQFEDFPAITENNPLGAFELIVPPLISVTTLAYKDADGADQTIDATNFDVNTLVQPGMVAPVADYTWPTAYDGLYPITITYLAGYATAAAVPFPLKQAMLLTIAHWYRNRVDTPRTLSSQAEFLLSTYRVQKF